MVGNSLFENNTYSFDSEDDPSYETITPYDDLHAYIQTVTTMATQEMADTNAIPGETRNITLPEPVPDAIKTAADLRTEVAALGGDHPLFTELEAGKIATALCISNPYGTAAANAD